MDDNDCKNTNKTKNENLYKSDNYKPSNQFCMGIICKNNTSKPKLSTDKIYFSIIPNKKFKDSKSVNKNRKIPNTVIPSSQILSLNNNNLKTNPKLLNKEKHPKKKIEYRTTYKNTTPNPNTFINSSNNTPVNNKVKNNNVKTIEINLDKLDTANGLRNKPNKNYDLNNDSIIINNIDNNIIYDNNIEQSKVEKNINGIIRNKWISKSIIEDELCISIFGKPKKSYQEIYMENLVNSVDNIENEENKYYLVSQNKKDLNYENIKSNMELKSELKKLISKMPKNSTNIPPAIVINEEQIKNLYNDIYNKHDILNNELKIFDNAILDEIKQFDEMIFDEKKIKKKSFEDELLIENNLNLVNIISELNNNLNNKNILSNEIQVVSEVNILGKMKINWNDLINYQNEVNFGIINNIKKKFLEDELLIENQSNSLINIIGKNRMLFNEMQVASKLDLLGKPKINWNDLNKNQYEISFGLINIINWNYLNKNQKEINFGIINDTKKKFPEEKLFFENQSNSLINITSNKNKLLNEIEIVSNINILSKPKINWNDINNNQNEINFGIINNIKKKFSEEKLLTEYQLNSLINIIAKSNTSPNEIQVTTKLNIFGKPKINWNDLNKSQPEISFGLINIINWNYLNKNQKEINFGIINNKNKLITEPELVTILEIPGNIQIKKSNYEIQNLEIELLCEKNNIKKNDFGQSTPASLLTDKFLIYAVSKNLKYSIPITQNNFSFLNNYVKKNIFDENYIRITGFCLWIEKVDKSRRDTNSTQNMDEQKDKNCNYINSDIEHSVSMNQSDIDKNENKNNVTF